MQRVTFPIGGRGPTRRFQPDSALYLPPRWRTALPFAPWCARGPQIGLAVGFFTGISLRNQGCPARCCDHGALSRCAALILKSFGLRLEQEDSSMRYKLLRILRRGHGWSSAPSRATRGRQLRGRVAPGLAWLKGAETRGWLAKLTMSGKLATSAQGTAQQATTTFPFLFGGCVRGRPPCLGLSPPTGTSLGPRLLSAKADGPDDAVGDGQVYGQTHVCGRFVFSWLKLPSYPSSALPLVVM